VGVSRRERWEPDEDPRRRTSSESWQRSWGDSGEVGDIVEVTFHRYPGKSVLPCSTREAKLAAGSAAPQIRMIDVAAVWWQRRGSLKDRAFPPADVVVLAL
jgi:8-oxo-dGTP diphosphatase